MNLIKVSTLAEYRTIQLFCADNAQKAQQIPK